MVTSSVNRTTGVVEISVATPWPSVSLAITKRVVDHVNEYNLQNRKFQATAELRFTEDRLNEAHQALGTAEERLQSFLRSNRQVGGSPDLTFERDKLQRDVSFQQALYISLAQAYEQVRIRQLRDTPSIGLFETPWVSAVPNARYRSLRALLGLILGGLAGLTVLFLRKVLAERRASDDADAVEFFGLLAEAKRRLTRRDARARKEIEP
jgi:uncharacterized protein involved in exopolysaccharide biosynthesis